METRTEKTCCCTATSCAGGRLDLLFGGIARLWLDGVPKPGGQDLKEIPPEQLHDQAAFVLQDNDLFDDTVRENIRMGRRGAADAQAEVAAHAAGCDGFSSGQHGMCADFIGGQQETESWKL